MTDRIVLAVGIAFFVFWAGYTLATGTPTCVCDLGSESYLTTTYSQGGEFAAVIGLLVAFIGWRMVSKADVDDVRHTMVQWKLDGEKQN